MPTSSRAALALGMQLAGAAPKAVRQALETGDFAGVTPAVIPDGCFAVTLGSDLYPPQLAAAHGPAVLYGRGNVDALSAGLAVVGTRRMSAYGQAVVDVAVAAARSADAVTISGLADGCDRRCAEQSLTAGAPHVAVVATGPDVIEPAGRAELAEAVIAAGGAVVSEHPFGVGADDTVGRYRPGAYASRLVARNRVIAGLAAATVLAESAVDGGAMHTVWYALHAGRPVIVAQPRSGAHKVPGMAGPAALAAKAPLHKGQLAAAGMPRALAESWEPGRPLAAVAAGRNELTTAVRVAVWLTSWRRQESSAAAA